MFDSPFVCTIVHLLYCVNVILVLCGHGNSEIQCDPTSRYSTIDGSCHNLKNPTYGMTGSLFRRILPPNYENNDGETPRLTGVSGKPLPSARKVSTEIHVFESRKTAQGTNMLMQWGQFLSHDITFTPIPDLENGACCGNDLNGTDHPDPTCFNILLGTHDRYYEFSCMEFARSIPKYDSNNIRQQFNNHSSWIDASQIYGDWEEKAQSLRSFKDGKLLVKVFKGQDFLPEGFSHDCLHLDKNDYCYKAGDFRSNVYPGLSALHTIFLRYHNQLCDRLKVIHQDWNDEKLYQEARKIIIAILQRITYDYFLPQILGPLAEKFQLQTGSYEYNDTIDPTLRNVFSAAAYRFGHSSVPDSLNIDGQVISTGSLILRSHYALESLPGVVNSLVSENCDQTDRFFTTGISNRLFEDPSRPRSGFDLVAMNIQRGRDHGLPPYNDWREHFGLERKTFETLGPDSETFRQVYESVDDIDLYSAGVNEENVEGAMVGEVFSKILPQQFHDLKFGDRFWYENQNDVTSFSKEQIQEILKMTLSRIICDTMPGYSKIQRDVFVSDGPKNPIMDCSTFEDIDISKF